MANNLYNGIVNNFKHLKAYYHDIDPKILNMMIKKGGFPYSFLDSFDKLNYEGFTRRREFYDDLKFRNLKSKLYRQDERVWKYFKCEKLVDYLKIYLAYDILLLADTFEKSRKYHCKSMN
jgi:hypothetical protein